MTDPVTTRQPLREDSTAVVISTEQRGLSNARNTGLKAATVRLSPILTTMPIPTPNG